MNRDGHIKNLVRKGKGKCLILASEKTIRGKGDNIHGITLWGTKVTISVVLMAFGLSLLALAILQLTVIGGNGTPILAGAGVVFIVVGYVILATVARREWSEGE